MKYFGLNISFNFISGHIRSSYALDERRLNGSSPVFENVIDTTIGISFTFGADFFNDPDWFLVLTIPDHHLQQWGIIRHNSLLNPIVGDEDTEIVHVLDPLSLNCLSDHQRIVIGELLWCVEFDAVWDMDVDSDIQICLLLDSRFHPKLLRCEEMPHTLHIPSVSCSEVDQPRQNPPRQDLNGSAWEIPVLVPVEAVEQLFDEFVLVHAASFVVFFTGSISLGL